MCSAPCFYLTVVGLTLTVYLANILYPDNIALRHFDCLLKACIYHMGRSPA